MSCQLIIEIIEISYYYDKVALIQNFYFSNYGINI